MKIVRQMGLILGISLAGELLHKVLGLPVPGSVYGMVLLLLLLVTGVVKLGQVEDVADFLISVMPLFFVPPAVALITAADSVKGSVGKLLVVCLVSTVLVIVVTGRTAQFVIRLRTKKKKEETEHE